MDCIFCDLMKSGEKIIDKDELCSVFYNTFPISKGHILIIPNRHVADYFDLTLEEANAIQKMLFKHKELLSAEDETITAFNVGVNAGVAAGQTVYHVHMHLIPRREGDVANPRGGLIEGERPKRSV